MNMSKRKKYLKEGTVRFGVRWHDDRGEEGFPTARSMGAAAKIVWEQVDDGDADIMHYGRLRLEERVYDGPTIKLEDDYYPENWSLVDTGDVYIIRALAECPPCVGYLDHTWEPVDDDDLVCLVVDEEICSSCGIRRLTTYNLLFWHLPMERNTTAYVGWNLSFIDALVERLEVRLIERAYENGGVLDVLGVKFPNGHELKEIYVDGKHNGLSNLEHEIADYLDYEGLHKRFVAGEKIK